MHLQLSTVSLFLSLTSTASAGLLDALGSATNGVAGALIGALGSADGKPASDGPIPMRRSITELAHEAGPQWDLYLQALRSMHDRDPSDPESFFQIAGIHGRPFVQYNNAGAENTNSWWAGYSTHGENLFIIWHRPFVALFEQTLVREAKNLAASYPDDLRSIYQRAAEDLRAPYWDWALEPWLPSASVPETIQVNAPTKTGVVSKTISNPLFTYRFPKEVQQGKFGAFSTYDRMYRCQTPEVSNRNLGSRNYKSQVYNTFTMSKSFSEFATTASRGSSLEGVHNSVHWDAGCGGQFMNSEYSAFEPLFMLHHSNVDRLWAYWQAMHPEASTFNGLYQGLSRFTTHVGTMIGLDSPLQPFKQVNGEWHTSRSVNDIKTFGYTYEGLDYSSKSQSEIQKIAAQMINYLYGPPGTPKPDTSSSKPKPTQSSTSSTSAQSTKSASQPQSTGPSTTIVKPSQSSHAANNGTVSSKLGGSSTASSQTGLVTSVAPSGTTGVMPTNSAGSDSHPDFNATMTGDYKHFYIGISVDVAYLPVRPCSIEVSIDMWSAGGMAIMKMPEKGVLYDSISLTDAIASAKLDHLSDDELLSQILSRLHVTIRKADGSNIDVTTVPGLKIDIEEVEVTAATSDDELPQSVKTNTHVVLEKAVSGCAAH